MQIFLLLPQVFFLKQQKDFKSSSHYIILNYTHLSKQIFLPN